MPPELPSSRVALARLYSWESGQAVMVRQKARMGLLLGLESESSCKDSSALVQTKYMQRTF
jgi:hypothetical protein